MKYINLFVSYLSTYCLFIASIFTLLINKFSTKIYNFYIFMKYVKISVCVCTIVDTHDLKTTLIQKQLGRKRFKEGNDLSKR